MSKQLIEIDESMVVVPRRLTAENGAKAALSGEFHETDFRGSDICVSWTTIKDIWRTAIDVVAIEPQEQAVQSLNVDSFALDLMQKVWQIGNRHGPDTQRKAEIQVAIAEAVAGLIQPAQAVAVPIPTSERLPTDEDADPFGEVAWWNSFDEFWQLIAWYDVPAQPIGSHWQPTGLTMPQPPESD